MNITLTHRSRLEGTLSLPGDKSLSHRALLLGGLSEGSTEVVGLSQGEDNLSTARCLEALGVRIQRNQQATTIHGVGLHGLRASAKDLDCGNSGSTMRMLMGCLAGQKFSSTLFGDASLSKRPMGRVAEPLRQMGAEILLTNERFSPLTLVGGRHLHGIEYELPVASAQVKSALILAGLYADGETRLTGKIESRDHTERLIPFFGGGLSVLPHEIKVSGGQALKGTRFTVPGDPSSAAYWLAGALVVKTGHVSLKNVLLNPTRTGFQNALKRMGATLHEEVLSENPEPVGNVEIRSGDLRGVTIDPSEVASLIDEIPMLAVLATFAHGTTEIRGAEELRVKESDRIESTAENLRRMGVHLETFPDGLRIVGPQKLKGATIDSFHDHRIAMAFAIGAMGAEGETVIRDCETVNISYPAFFSTLETLTRG